MVSHVNPGAAQTFTSQAQSSYSIPALIKKTQTVALFAIKKLGQVLLCIPKLFTRAYNYIGVPTTLAIGLTCYTAYNYFNPNSFTKEEVEAVVDYQLHLSKVSHKVNDLHRDVHKCKHPNDLDNLNLNPNIIDTLGNELQNLPSDKDELLGRVNPNYITQKNTKTLNLLTKLEETRAKIDEIEQELLEMESNASHTSINQNNNRRDTASLTSSNENLRNINPNFKPPFNRKGGGARDEVELQISDKNKAKNNQEFKDEYENKYNINEDIPQHTHEINFQNIDEEDPLKNKDNPLLDPQPQVLIRSTTPPDNETPNKQPFTMNGSKTPPPITPEDFKPNFTIPNNDMFTLNQEEISNDDTISIDSNTTNDFAGIKKSKRNKDNNNTGFDAGHESDNSQDDV